jgi:hypothetical protein
MKYIHFDCLKHWMKDRDKNFKPGKQFCEICQYKYHFLFNYQYVCSTKKTSSMMKNMALVLVVCLVALALVDVLIMVVIGSVTTVDENLKKTTILFTLIGISFGILIIIALSYLRDLKKNYYDKRLIDWRIKDYEEGK